MQLKDLIARARYRKGVRRFVESESDMDVRDNDCCLFVEAGAARKFARVFVKQGEIVSYECYRKTCPLTCVACVGNSCEFSALGKSFD